MVSFQKQQDAYALFDTQDGSFCGRLHAVLVRPGNDSYWRPYPLRPLEDGSDSLIFASKSGSVSLHLSFLGDAVHALVGTAQVTGTGHAIVRLIWESADTEVFPFVPGFMYNVNRGGGSPRATYPRLKEAGAPDGYQPWVADEWLVRTDRSSHGLAALIAKGKATGLGGSDVCRYEDGTIAEKTGLGISKTRRRISFSLGYANDPYTYSTTLGRNRFNRTEGWVNLDRGSVSCPIVLYQLPGGDIAETADALLRTAYAVMHPDEEREPSNDAIRETASSVADAMVRYAYNDADNNFYVTLPDSAFDPDAEEFRFAYNTAWTGGTQVAYPLLRAGLQFGRAEWVRSAGRTLTRIAAEGLSTRSNFLYENYDRATEQWNLSSWWYDLMDHPGHSSYVNGQACFDLLAAYRLAEGRGYGQEVWLRTAERVLKQAVRTQRADGAFGIAYAPENGELLDADGFAGCWFVPALVLLDALVPGQGYGRAAVAGMDHYRSWLDRFELYGTPHDTYKSPDNEGILAFIRAAHLLHAQTGDDCYLKDLRRAFAYEFSWRFAYNPVIEHNPLRAKQWRACGGSITSVNNSHVHPMSCSVLDSLLYLSDQTQDPYYASRYRDGLRWALSLPLAFDGDYDWGKKGMVNERFCYTDALLEERYPDGSPASTWFCAHSWAAASVLEGLVAVLQGPALPRP